MSEKKQPTRKGERLSAYLDQDLVEECRDTVVALSGPPDRLTLSKLMEDALRLYLDRIYQEHQVEKFPKREGNVPHGRPMNK